MSSLSVTALVIKQLENAAKDVSRQHINLLAEKYSFNAAEAIAFLDINAPLTLEEKKMARKAKAEGDDSSSSNKKKVIPLPWMGMVDPNCCQAITYNYGLFTQCPKKKVGTSYCVACEKSCGENAAGEPACGTVSKRIATADYVDSKGRKPTQYGKVLHKLKIEMADAIAFASEKGFTIPDCHLEEYVPPADSKGRPKKGDKEVTSEGLFDSLVENSSTGSSTKGKKLSPEEKIAREEKRKAEKAEKEQAAVLKKGYENTAKALAAIGKDVDAIVAEGIPEEIAQAAIDKYNEAQSKKAELAAKREAEKAEKKKLADEKKALEKAEKEAKKEADKAAKIALAKATAEAKKAKKTGDKPVQVASAETKAVAQAVAQPQPQAEAPAVAVKVQRININGEVVKKGTPGGDYLRDSNNIVYNADTREPIGTWKENKIVFDTASEEKEEEEYEEM